MFGTPPDPETRPALVGDLILGVDRLLDMTRTMVNITGDATVTTIVARSEGELDLDVFNDTHAGEAYEEEALETGSRA